MAFRQLYSRLAALLCCAVAIAPASAFAVSWNRMATIDNATATNSALCYWNSAGAGTLECASTNPYIVGGFLGIGSSSPVNALDIGTSQGIRIASGTPTSTAYALYNNGGTLTWNGSPLSTLSGTGNTGYDAIWTSATSIGTGLIYESGGKVGIGTASPQQMLHLYGGASVYPAIELSGSNSIVNSIMQSVYTGTTSYGLQFMNGSSQPFVLVSNPTYGVAIGSGYATSNTPVNGLLVQGNVGIGTTSPGQILVLSQSSSTFGPIFQLSNTDITDGNASQISFQLNNLGGSNTGIGYIRGYNLSHATNSESGALTFGTKNSGTFGERMRIDYTGNIGIGTNAPTNKLDVNGAASIGYVNFTAPSNGMIVQGNVGIGTTNPLYALHVSTDVKAQSFQLSDPSNPQTLNNSGKIWSPQTSAIAFNTGGSEQMRITNTGNVGIGTTSPGSALQVNGGAAVGYSASTAAPSNGLAVSGSVGVGTTAPATGMAADINGPVKVAGTGSESCTAAQVGAIRYNKAGQYFEVCNYP